MGNNDKINYDIFCSMTLNERLTFLRERKGINKAELCAIMDVAPATVTQWESGKKTPGRKNLSKLAEFYGVTLDYLIKGIEKKELSSHEIELIDLYRNASESIKTAIWSILSNTK
ncbi:Transcriptional regulator [Commensalibacter communis]|uniref:helix-turn-helix domain-containing protein n=1 Tax=Commensalibacter communis TaxID=2972786 RepID=UPI0022FF7380|nr:helix-turn-helix transcriptional regulator [Commensalibacter communis]CAI3953706.1 Transcriptional regulator [Commensalibacter communis]CAI3959110.1 Transcriptional regulator [Commensalibacter communis]